MNQSYSIIELTEILSGNLIQKGQEEEIQNFLTDSRKISFGKGSLFVAISGDHFDGHKYLIDAYARGVRSFLVEKNEFLEGLDQANVILVENTLNSVQKWMAFHRSQFDIPVLGITGSNGKTTVKEWLNQLLADDYRIARSPNSYNSQIGVPKSVSNMDENTEFGMFEAGISQPGEMSKLAEIIKPTLGLITNIGSAHRENFKTELDLIIEKIKLFEGCTTVFAPSKNEDLNRELAKGSYKVLTWGDKINDDLRIMSIDKTGDLAIIICAFNNYKYDFVLHGSDEASVRNILPCVLIMFYLNFDFETIQDRISRLRPIEMRMEIKEGILNSTILNDAYSLDITSLEIGLELLAVKSEGERKIVVLSDFSASRDNSNENILRLNQLLKIHKVDYLIGIGPSLSKHQKLFDLPYRMYSNKTEFLKQLDEEVFDSGFVLVKGARIAGLEEVVERLQRKSHKTLLEINMESVSHNLNYFKSLLDPGVKLMVMVKAFSYGSGNREMAQFLQFNNVDYLGVAYMDEGVELRKKGISLPIMVMSPEIGSIGDCVRYHLEPEIYHLNILKELAREVKRSPDVKINVHIKVETGMNRLGFSHEELKEAVDLIMENPQIKVISVYSHLSSADMPSEDVFTLQQIENFKKAFEYVEKTLDYKIIKHLLNTSGILRFRDFQFDMVRLGIGLYGISPVGEFSKNLKIASRLKASISQIKEVKKGESVGYSRKFIAKQDTRIATIPIGYADGLSRALSNGVGSVFIKDKLLPIVGNICMDMTMIDLKDLPCDIGDEVVLFGPEHPIENMADALNTIPYEIMTSISQRVKRVYTES